MIRATQRGFHHLRKEEIETVILFNHKDARRIKKNVYETSAIVYAADIVEKYDEIQIIVTTIFGSQDRYRWDQQQMGRVFRRAV